MKLRNRLIALVCLLLFAGVGVVFFRDWVVQKPFAVILFVGDGLSSTKLPAARLYQGGANGRLDIEDFPHLALLANSSEDFAVPDTWAAATALASGQRTAHRSLGVGPDGQPIDNLFDIAIAKGRTTALVTNGALYDSAPAAFYGHAQGNIDPDKLVAQLAGASSIQLLVGGGAARFLPESKEGWRKDGRDLLIEMRQKGYQIIRSRQELEDTPGWTFPKILALFGDDALPHSNTLESGGSEPALADLVRSAIGLLQYHRNGYFLVVDAGLIERAARANKGELTLVETLELDRAVRTAREYAGENALIIVTGKQSIGGMDLNGYPHRKDSGMALLGTNPAGIPSISWATGPAGEHKENGAASPEDESPTVAFPATTVAGPAPEPAAHYAPEAINTAEDVIAVGIGAGSENLNGFMQTTDLFQILSAQF